MICVMSHGYPTLHSRINKIFDELNDEIFDKWIKRRVLLSLDNIFDSQLDIKHLSDSRPLDRIIAKKMCYSGIYLPRVIDSDANRTIYTFALSIQGSSPHILIIQMEHVFKGDIFTTRAEFYNKSHTLSQQIMGEYA